MLYELLTHALVRSYIHMRRTGIHANMHVNHNFASLILQVMEKTVAFVFRLISLQTSRFDSSDQKTVVLDVFASF